MRPCDRTVAQNFPEIAQDLVFWTQKCTIYHCLTFLGSYFKLFCWFLAHFVCAKLLNRNIVRAKKIAFRKSAYSLYMEERLAGKKNSVKFSHIIPSHVFFTIVYFQSVCTAVHCSAMHYNALHCNTLQCTALNISAVNWAALHYTFVQGWQRVPKGWQREPNFIFKCQLSGSLITIILTMNLFLLYHFCCSFRLKIAANNR